MKASRISIIIPAYNEEKRIGRTLKAYKEFFEDLSKRKVIDYKILVVINNTKDKTEEIVKKFVSKKITYLNLKEGGKGLAIIAGFKEEVKENKSDLIGFVDADMSTSPEAFFDLIKNIKDYDGIIASRYVKGAKVFPKQPLKRILISRFGNFMINSLFFLNLKDTQCGAKVFRKKAVENILEELKLTQWAFDVNLLYILKKKGFKVKEFPTVWKDAPDSTLKIKEASIKAFLSVVRLRVIYSPLKKILKPFKVVETFIWKVMEK